MRWGPLLSAILVGACAGTKTAPGPAPAVSAADSRNDLASPAAVPRPAGEPLPRAARWVVADRFEKYLAGYQDLTAAGLRSELGLRAPADPPLGFDPASARYYAEVVSALKLTGQELGLLRSRGMVSVDHVQRYSMGSAYFAIYSHDLPVLITTDSILHALHRSYDQVLQQLESALLAEIIERVLLRTHEELARRARTAGVERLRLTLRDVDLYLTVARNLLRGAGAAERGEPQPHSAGGPDVWNGKLLVRSALGQDQAALAVLESIRSLRLQDPLKERTAIYGGLRAIDYSQFAPRGHYTKSTPLRRYFRAMMWLGRSDLGWNLGQPSGMSLLKVDLARERRSALVLSYLIRSAGAASDLEQAGAIIDFMVGKSDNAGVADVTSRFAAAGVKALADLADDGKVEQLVLDLIQSGAGRQQIRSQTLGSHVGDTVKTLPPAVFQPFGQRFVIDSFVLSQVVFDSIVFQGEKQLRELPRGLDVMAALGNDEAVRLLEPELERYKYAANLLAARRVVDDYTPELWNENLYHVWLNALRTLDDTARAGKHLPRAMQGEAWRRKQLQTQLGSWAELRHDTVLYAKQSYTGYALCEYPAGFVEPYPEFYAALGGFGRRAAELLRGARVAHPNWRVEHALKALVEAQARYFDTFASVLQMLERLATKELRAEPFTADEIGFIKRTIDIRGGGSGMPRYDGWYTALIYDLDPSSWEPVIADVHTSPKLQRVLEAGVGNVDLTVVAIDNQGDRAVYVGPTYSYYEFSEAADRRLTDELWQQRIARGNLPPRPAWVSSFHAGPSSRQLDRSNVFAQRNPAQDPRAVEDPALARLLERVAAGRASYNAGYSALRDVDKWRTSGAPGPRPPEPISTAALDERAAASRSKRLARRIHDVCRLGSSGIPGPRAVITVGSNGRVLSVRLYPPELARSAQAGCVEQELRTFSVPPFNRPFVDWGVLLQDPSWR